MWEAPRMNEYSQNGDANKMAKTNLIFANTDDAESMMANKLEKLEKPYRQTHDNSPTHWIQHTIY